VFDKLQQNDLINMLIRPVETAVQTHRAATLNWPVEFTANTGYSADKVS